MATPVSNKKRKPNWNDDEVKILLRVWKEYHKRLTTAKRNQYLYGNMAKEMELYGVFREGADIRCKIKNLTKMFKVEKAQEFVEGKSSKWRFYGKISEILGEDVNFIGYLKNSDTKFEDRFPRIKGKFAKASEAGQATILRLGFKQESNEVENSLGFSQKSNEVENSGFSRKSDEVEDSAFSPKSDDVENSDEDAVLEPEQSHIYNESTRNSFDGTEMSWDRRRGEGHFMEELYQDYRDTKQSLVETDKQILELLANQNDLIKTQNELCRTQNTILTSLLEKMK